MSQQDRSFEAVSLTTNPTSSPRPSRSVARLTAFMCVSSLVIAWDMASLCYGADPASNPDERAIALYTEAIALRPEDSLSHYQRGVAYARLGRLNEALVDFNESIRLEPKAARSYSNQWLGGSAGDHDETLPDLRLEEGVHPVERRRTG